MFLRPREKRFIVCGNDLSTIEMSSGRCSVLVCTLVGEKTDVVNIAFVSAEQLLLF